MWPPYYTAQRGMNPMGYPTAGIQMNIPQGYQVSYRNMVDEVEKNEAAKRKNRNQLLLASGLTLVAVFFLIRTFNK